MPPTGLRPFPYSLSVGTDICSVKRIRDLLEKKQFDDPVERLTKRLFTPYERGSFSARFQNSLQEARQGRVSQQVCDHIAGRWAAKEAVIKACRWRRLLLQDISITRSKHRPDIYGIIHDEAVRPRPSDNESSLIRKISYRGLSSGDGGEHNNSGQIVEVSISHDGDFATAVCLCPSQPGENDVGGEAEARGYR